MKLILPKSCHHDSKNSCSKSLLTVRQSFSLKLCNVLSISSRLDNYPFEPPFEPRLALNSNNTSTVNWTIHGYRRVSKFIWSIDKPVIFSLSFICWIYLYCTSGVTWIKATSSWGSAYIEELSFSYWTLYLFRISGVEEDFS